MKSSLPVTGNGRTWSSQKRNSDSRKQNILVTIPGIRIREELVLNDIVDASIETAERANKTEDWRLGYALTVHSSQGLTISAPQKVWIIDDYLQRSNLAYLAVSRAEYLSQLQRVACPPADKQEGRQPTKQELRKAIQKSLWPTNAITKPNQTPSRIQPEGGLHLAAERTVRRTADPRLHSSLA